MKCKECPFLLAIEGTNVSREMVDEIKAWTCATHILTEKAKKPMSFDDSEGFIVTVDDKMYWQNVYESLSQGVTGQDKEYNEHCPSCGEIVLEDADYCWNCNAEL